MSPKTLLKALNTVGRADGGQADGVSGCPPIKTTRLRCVSDIREVGPILCQLQCHSKLQFREDFSVSYSLRGLGGS